MNPIGSIRTFPLRFAGSSGTTMFSEQVLVSRLESRKLILLALMPKIGKLGNSEKNKIGKTDKSENPEKTIFEQSEKSDKSGFSAGFLCFRWPYRALGGFIRPFRA